MLNEHIFEASFGLYILGAIIAVLLNSRALICSGLSYGCSAAAALLGLGVAFSVILSGPIGITLHRTPIADFSLFIDGLSALFIIVISLASLAVSIYSTGYVREYHGKKSTGLLGFLYNIFILSMILVVSANNAILF